MRWLLKLLSTAQLVACSAAAPSAATARTEPRDGAALARACAGGEEAACGELAADLSCALRPASAAVADTLARGCPAFARACAVAADELLELGNQDEAALRLADEGCQHRDAGACQAIAEYHVEKHDHQAADAAYRRGCELEAWVCNNWAFLYFQRGASDADFERAHELFERACAGWAQACVHLAAMEESPEQELAILSRACERDNTACHGLAARYWEGKIVPRDEARALELARRTCSPAGDTIGCSILHANDPELFAAAKLQPPERACRYRVNEL